MREACQKQLAQAGEGGRGLVVCPFIAGQLDWAHAWEAEASTADALATDSERDAVAAALARASDERTDARMILTLKPSYNCATTSP